jgi:hypothetical protein
VARGLAETRTPYLGTKPLSEKIELPWLQLLADGGPAADAGATALLQTLADDSAPVRMHRLEEDQLLGLVVSSTVKLEQAIGFALDQGLDLLLLNGAATPMNGWPELGHAPNLQLLRDAVAILRRLGREEAIDLIHFGGVRSGTDAAKLVGLGAVAMVLGVTVGLAAGGRIGDNTLLFDSGLSDEERAQATANVIRASIGEASMMARCTGKTNLHNIEPEDLRALTLATAEATGIPLAGTRA